MKKAKKIFLKIIFFIAAFIVGGVIGTILISLYENSDFGGPIFVFEIALSFILSFFITTVIHEGGHLVFGLISGYSFSSFRIGSIMLVKINGKLRIRSFNLAGTGGQCLMIPPKKDIGKAKVILYNLGGVIFNVIFCFVCIAAMIFMPYVFVVSLTAICSCFLSLFFAVTNGIPMNVGGIANDGMNALSLSKDERARHAFDNQLRMNAAGIGGKKLSEMPDEWFEIPEGADMKNTVFASIAVFRVNRSFESLNISKSEQEIESLLATDYAIIGLHRHLLTCDLISCKLLLGRDNDDIKSLITPELKKTMSAMKSFISVSRTEYLISLLLDRDETAAKKKKIFFEKIIKNHPNSADVETERKFMELASGVYENSKIKV